MSYKGVAHQKGTPEGDKLSFGGQPGVHLVDNAGKGIPHRGNSMNKGPTLFLLLFPTGNKPPSFVAMQVTFPVRPGSSHFSILGLSVLTYTIGIMIMMAVTTIKVFEKSLAWARADILIYRTR